jgi:predicted ATP-grasp superfamily ATP-dependent carboligase
MALAAARSLARRGIEVHAVHFAQKKPVAAFSRCLQYVKGPDLDRDDAVLQFLLDFGRRFADRPVLMPAQDHAVLFMHRHRDALRERYRLYVWESDELPQSGSKCGLRGVAERHRLPVPKTVAPRDRDELEEGIRQLTFPCIVKPEFTMQWWNPAARALGLSRKAIRVNDAEELRELYDRTEKLGSRVVVQQMVMGPDSGHMSYTVFVSPEGKITAELVARKLRIHPPRFGVGCYLEATVVDDARQVGREIIERLGFRGFASLQFKRDERDGRLYLLEINLRFPIWIDLPIACGVDHPWYFYQA